MITVLGFLYLSNVSLQDKVGVEFFYLLATIFPFLIFSQKEKTHIYISLLSILLTWSAGKIVGYEAFPAYFIVDNAPLEILYNINFILVFALLAVYINIFVNAISALNKELIIKQEQLEKNIGALEISRDEAIEAGKANNEKTMFISNMSHELRTPIHSISSFGKILIKHVDLKKSLDKEKIVDYCHRIISSADRILLLVNNLLMLSSLEKKDIELRLIQLDLSSLADTVHSSLLEKANKKNLTITSDSNKPFIIDGDPGLISQVISHIFNNAINFSENNGVINYSVYAKKMALDEQMTDVVCFSIRDEGCGIPGDEIDTIFESFSQSKRTDTGAGGTGLGLSIARNIIALHQGRIWAESGDDIKGTTITFCLPLSSTDIPISDTKD